MPRTGAVESTQVADLDLPEGASSLLTRSFLQRAATEYWRLIRRWTLGLIRVSFEEEDQCVVLVGRPLVLLRFHAPEFELDADHGSVTWRIRRGILVARNGRDRGFLRLSLARTGDDPSGRVRLRVQMQVQNFYPWLRGAGGFARIGVWIYAQTQQRIHRAVTRGFLRRLASSGGES